MDEPTPPRTAGQVWAEFPQDPRDPGHAGLRASDADRDRVNQVLTEAFADGRLTREEYDERSASAFAARTLGELPPLLVDLLPERVVSRATTPVPLVDAGPVDLQRRAEEKYLDIRRNALLAFLGPSLVCWLIWVFTAWGPQGFHPYFPWPLFVTVPVVVNAVRVAASRREITQRELRTLEDRQAKALEARRRPPGA